MLRCLATAAALLPVSLGASSSADVCARGSAAGRCTAGAPPDSGVVLMQVQRKRSLTMSTVSDLAAGQTCQGEIQWKTHPTSCFDVSGGSKANGNDIQLWDCYEGHPNMVFQLPESGRGLIRWAANPNKCLDVSGGRYENGNHVQIWDCFPDSPNQQFEMSDGHKGEIKWAGTNKCFDVSGGRHELGTSIQIWDCAEGHANMQFQVKCAGEEATTMTTTPSPSPTECHTAVWPEDCFNAVSWAMTVGFEQTPSWYPGLTEDSAFEDFQRLLHVGGHGPNGVGEANYVGCQEPCPAPSTTTRVTTTRGTPPPTSPSGAWEGSGTTFGEGSWCAVEEPVPEWTLMQGCGDSGLHVKVLTYNLFWWNLFGVRGGNGGSAGKLIGANGPYDIMGFQECEDVWRVLDDAGLRGQYNVLPAARALCTAFKTDTWERISSGVQDVAEDNRYQYYGRRAVQWGRLRHKATGKVVFFLNHHGPLQVNTGGQCSGEATAFNILKVIAERSEASDAKIMLGDLNNDAGSVMQSKVKERMDRVISNWVDAIFTSCSESLIDSKNLGTGGSDHNALEATFRL